MREPCIMRWPGRIPAGTVTDEPGMNIDLLPTLAKLVGASLPDHPIDGLDIWPLLSGEAGAKNPHHSYWHYYAQNELQAVSQGYWKLVLPHGYRTLGNQPIATGGVPVKYSAAKVEQPELYDLSNDIGEKTNLAADYPAVVAQLLEAAETARRELGDKLTKRAGAGIREPGRLTKAEADEIDAWHGRKK